MTLRWQWAHFSELTTEELYQILQLREAVFVLEQRCFYQDIDGKDSYAWHLMAVDDGGELVAYLRVVAPGVKYAEPSIGRVITKERYRGRGIGKLLLQKGIEQTRGQFHGADIRISAQLHLSGLYRRVGFECVGEQYLEDGIPHIEMLLTCV